MFENRMDQCGRPGLDAIAALGLTVLCIRSLAHHVGVRHLLATKIWGVDALFGVAFIFAWQYCFSALNLYSPFATVQSRILATLKGVSIMTACVVLYLELVHHHAVTFGAGALLLTVLFFCEVGRIAFSTYFLDYLAARDPRRAIIVGSGRRAGKAWRSIRTRYHRSIRLLGFVDNRTQGEMAPEIAQLFLGTIAELNELLLNQVVDVILIAMPIQSCYPLMQQAVDTAEAAGVQVIYLGDIYSSRNSRAESNQAIFHELAPQQQSYLTRLVVKRITDVCGAVIGISLLAPVMLCIAAAIKLTSKGPVLFRQERYGRRRRLFHMLKFRTMVENAEQMLSELEHLNEATGPIFKMRDDPRTTAIGRFLRRTSLDELPQLWNVLVGEMSLVGPRPMTVRDVSLFDDAVLMRRFSVTPGMTGLWQVNGRSEVGFDQWIALDCRYIDKWSLSLDLKILLQTLDVMFKRSGAM